MRPEPQPTLDGTPAASGPRLWARFLDSSWTVIHGEWMRACAENAFVGVCDCGGYLSPDRPEELLGRIDYHARCTVCRRDVDAPGGRVLRRSSAHNQMPAGWMDHRFPKTKGGS